MFNSGHTDSIRWMISPNGASTIRNTLNFCTDLTSAEYDIGDELDGLAFIGDWTVRADALRDQIIAGLQEILSQVTHVPLTIEKRTALRPVIVVTGNYVFRPLSPAGKADDIQLFVDRLNPKSPTADSDGDFHTFLRWIERLTRHRVFDETASRPEKVSYATHRDVWGPTSNEVVPLANATDRLSRLLNNVANQTSLHFEQTERYVEIYFIRSKSAATLPPTTESAQP